EVAGLGGQRREQRPALEAGSARVRHDRHEVVEGEGGVEAEVVGLLPERDQVLVGGVLGRGLDAEAERAAALRLGGARPAAWIEGRAGRTQGANGPHELSSSPLLWSRHVASPSAPYNPASVRNSRTTAAGSRCSPSTA